MADIKISALPAVSTPGGTDELVVNQGGATSRITVANLMGYGNGGQPPAPKPRSATSADIGHLVNQQVMGADWVLPAGGTWAYLVVEFVAASGLWNGGFISGVAAGGTIIKTASAGIIYTGVVWRVS